MHWATKIPTRSLQKKKQHWKKICKKNSFKTVKIICGEKQKKTSLVFRRFSILRASTWPLDACKWPILSAEKKNDSRIRMWNFRISLGSQDSSREKGEMQDISSTPVTLHSAHTWRNTGRLLCNWYFRKSNNERGN